MTLAHFDIGRLPAGTSILLAICATLLTVGCASGHRLAPNVLQSSTGRQAEVIPGTWDRVAELRPGSRVVVTLIDGERREGVFKALSPGDLDLTDSAGQNFGVARSNIRQIVARGERDGLMNGALIGAGIGVGIAATILAVVASEDGYVLASAKWGAPLLLSGVGAVIGVLIDRGHTNDQVVYVRP